MNNDWKYQPISQQEWELKCQASSHVRPGDALNFVEPRDNGVIHCWIKDTSVFLGAYFKRGDNTGIQSGTGWCHE
jgi:hypothetical protein